MKKKPCKYCSAWEKKPAEWECGEILLCGTAYTYVGNGAYHYTLTRYCPNCGRKLQEEAHNGE